VRGPSCLAAISSAVWVRKALESRGARADGHGVRREVLRMIIVPSACTGLISHSLARR
jgi:hypothetical protein